MPAYAHGGIHEPCPAQSLQAEVGQVVGQIVPGLISAADHYRDRQAVGNEFVEQQVQALDQGQRLVAGNAAGCDVGIVKRGQGPVQVSGRHQAHRIAVLNREYGQPEKLNGFPERAGRLVGDPFASLGNQPQLPFPLRPAFGNPGSRAFRRVFYHRRKAFHGRNERAVCILPLARRVFRPGLDAVSQPVDSEFEDLPEIYFAMSGLSARPRVLLEQLAGIRQGFVRGFGAARGQAAGKQLEVVYFKSRFA